MNVMADPMIVLNQLRNEALNAPELDSSDLDDGYLIMRDEMKSGSRFCFVKVIGKEVLALAIFGTEKPVNGLYCLSVGYAVNETFRGRGLALEAVNKGLKSLKELFKSNGVETFYLEAMVAETNIHSIKIARQIFPKIPESAVDGESGTPSYFFSKLVAVR